MLSRLSVCYGHVCSRSIMTTSTKLARFGNTGGFFQQGFRLRTQTGPTLRERFLGPTTGKPFIYGTYAIAGASVFGVGMLCYYGLGVSKQMSAMDRAALWPDYVRERLRSTYGYLASSLAITAGSAALASRSSLILGLTTNGFGVILGMIAVIGATTVVRSIDYHKSPLQKHLAWMAACGVWGCVLSSICLVGGPVILRAACYTAGLYAGLVAIALTAPSEKFLMMSAPLSMGLAVVFLSNIGTFFLPPGSALGAGLASIVVYGGLILFSAFLLYDTQRLIRIAESHPENNTQTLYNQWGEPMQTIGVRGFDPINAQMSLYMDILNIFIRMVMLSGGSQRRK